MKILKKAALPVAISLVALSGALTAQAAEENENKGPEFYGMLYVSMDLQKSEAGQQGNDCSKGKRVSC